MPVHSRSVATKFRLMLVERLVPSAMARPTMPLRGLRMSWLMFGHEFRLASLARATAPSVAGNGLLQLPVRRRKMRIRQR